MYVKCRLMFPALLDSARAAIGSLFCNYSFVSMVFAIAILVYSDLYQLQLVFISNAFLN